MKGNMMKKFGSILTIILGSGVLYTLPAHADVFTPDNSEGKKPQVVYPQAGDLPDSNTKDRSLFLQNRNGGRLDYIALKNPTDIPDDVKDNPLRELLAPGYTISGGSPSCNPPEDIANVDLNLRDKNGNWIGGTTEQLKKIKTWLVTNYYCPIPKKWYTYYCFDGKLEEGGLLNPDVRCANTRNGSHYAYVSDDSGGAAAISNAILGQNLYLARMEQSARDIYPPSYNSSRKHGTEYGKSENDHVYDSRNKVYGMLLNSYGQYQGGTTWKEVTDVELVKQRLDNYCGIYENAKGLCPSKNSQWKDSMKELANRDLLATSLFANTIDSYPATAVKNVQNRLYPGLDYINNVVGMQPEQPKISGTSAGKSSIEEYKKLMKFYTKQARLSLARESLVSIYQDHVVNTNLSIPEKYIPNTIKGDNKPTMPQAQSMIATSRFGLMQFEANKRFDTPDWYDSLNQQSTQGLLKEMAIMMATQLKLQFATYQQNQRIEALLATQLASSNNLSTMSATADEEKGTSSLPTK